MWWSKSKKKISLNCSGVKVIQWKYSSKVQVPQNCTYSKYSKLGKCTW